MADQLIVHFKELPVLPYQMDYLTYCKHCGTYNLANKACVECNQVEEITLEEMTAKTVSKQLMKRELMMIGFYAVFFIVTMDLLAILLGAVITIGGLVANRLIYKKYKEAFILSEMHRHINSHIDQIKEDLNKQMGIAIKDVEEGRPVEAYDRFRYLSKLIDNDDVRTYKLICLKNFKLRRDMPLELKEMLQEDYNTYLVDYIYEVSKLKKELIDDATLDYMVRYEEEVLSKHKGNRIMASVLEGTLKSKFLLNKYAEKMPTYIECFSRERLLRLCKMSKGIKDETLRAQILHKVNDIVGTDEAFGDYLQEIQKDENSWNHSELVNEIDGTSTNIGIDEMDLRNSNEEISVTEEVDRKDKSEKCSLEV